MGTTQKLARTLGPLAALVAVWLLFAALVPEGRFTAWDNQQLMLLQTAVVGTAAMGATLIIASGGIDLSIGSTVALCTMVIAWLINHGWPPVLAAVVGGVGASAAVGAAIGGMVTGHVLSIAAAATAATAAAAWPGTHGWSRVAVGLTAAAGAIVVGGAVIGGATRGRAWPKPMPRLLMPPFIVTLGMLGILRGLAQGLGGQQPIYTKEGAAGPLLELMLTRGGVLPWGVWIFLLTAAAMGFVLSRTVVGRRALAIGDNATAARYAGVPVDLTKIVVYAVGVGCGGLAAVMQFSYLNGMGDPGTGLGLELSVIASCVIGGASLTGGSASVLGTIVGALLMTVVANGCTKLDMQPWVQTVVTGVIIVGAVALDQWRRR